MTAETDLLPLPDVKLDGFTTHDMRDYARANLAELQREVEGLRAEVERLEIAGRLHSGTADLAINAVRAAEARAERLAEAGRRVTAAFRALGEATAWTRAAEQARHECEAAMLALDAALDQETTNG